MSRIKLALLKRPAPTIDDPPPVAVFIPAKDEGPRVAECLRSVTSQDYPNFRTIAVDDRSTDQTGRIMDELSAQHPTKLKIIHINQGELAEGWTGKCNALHRAVRQEAADAQWLLFVDSDVILQPDALSATLGRAAKHNYDLLSLLPRIESHTFFEALLVPVAGAAVSTMYAVVLTNKDHYRKTAFANGQYLLIRRSAYETIGGHESVHDRFCEDVELARLAKAQGYTVRIASGADFAAVRMYTSLPAIERGWARNFYAASLGKPWRILAALAFIVVTDHLVLGDGVVHDVVDRAAHER